MTGARCMGEAVSRGSQGILPAMAECARETGSGCVLFSSTVVLPLGRQCIFTVLSYIPNSLVSPLPCTTHLHCWTLEAQCPEQLQKGWLTLCPHGLVLVPSDQAPTAGTRPWEAAKVPFPTQRWESVAHHSQGTLTALSELWSLGM